MPDSYDRYRSRLEALASDAWLVPLVNEAAERLRWCNEVRSWSRTYGRFDPDAEAFVDLVFETTGSPQLICRVQVLEAPPHVETPDSCLFETQVGWLLLTRFPNDPCLSGLPHVLASGQAIVVRYRPSRRCTIRVERDGRVLFAKVMANLRGETIHAESVALWAAAQRGEIGFQVAEPVAWDPETLTLWQGQLAGLPLRNRLTQPDGLVLVEQAGRAAASLHRSALQPKALLDRNAQMKRSRRDVAEIVRRVPRLASLAECLLGRLSSMDAPIQARPLRPIHGAFRPEQCLVSGQQLGLIDFDRFSMGDPELDAALFIAALDAGDQAEATTQLVEAFRAGYEVAGRTLDRRLLLEYELQQQLAKALRRAWAVRPDGDSRAEQALIKALRRV